MVDVDSIKPLHVLADVGHGGAGTVIEELCRFLPVQITGLGMTPDGNFPLGVPNPMLKEQQSRTGAAVLTAGADFGVSWDGDFDRCFFFDEHGNYIDPYYITGLFAEVFLVSQPHSNIVHDIRLAWHSVESIEGAGGVSCPSKSGHAYMKTTMRQCDAIYGGETTGHHYFKDFYYCDSGIIPFLLMLAVLSSTDMTLSQLIAKGRTDFPCSGEINLPLQVAAHEIIERVRTHYRPSAIEENDLDGLSMSFDRWRFNVRGSNTEPLLRINVESRADEALLKEKCDELLALIAS
jgi:phosphomannomutase